MFASGLVLALIIVAWLSAGAMAVRSASRIWLRHWAERQLRGSEAVHLYLARPHRLLAAANAAMALTLGLAGASIAWGDSQDTRAAAFDAIAYAVVVIVLGFIVPRVLARRWPDVFVPLCMPVLRTAEVVTAPILAIGRALAPAPAEAAAGEPARDPLQDLLREGELEGIGSTSEISIISGVVEFAEKRVADVMTPWSEVFAIPDGQPPERVAALIAESAFSRVPVFKGAPPAVIGMYHAFDVLKARGSSHPPLRPVAFATPTTLCNDLLVRMLTARRHLAVVQDASGRALGIATLEDLLEELVGDIRDEHDEPAEAARVTA